MASAVELVKQWDHGVNEYKLHGGGVEVNIFNNGGIIKSILAPDKDGVIADVTLGHDQPQEYVGFYFGALIGRFANRIAEGKFSLDGVDYQLAVNNGPNHLHGGCEGFDKKVWEAEIQNSQLILRYISEDGEEQYPGQLKVKVIYEVTSEGELVIDYTATCDKATVLNLTNHAYFNLEGQDKGDIFNHRVELACSEYTPKNAANIPTGEIAAVADTAFDLRKGKVMSEANLNMLDLGYDHNFLVPGEQGQRRYIGRVTAGGRQMEVYTTQPAVQLYTGYYIDCPAGKGGVPYGRYSGLCLETQNYPDAPNKPNFPSAVLRPGEVYHHTTWYKFSAES